MHRDDVPVFILWVGLQSAYMSEWGTGRECDSSRVHATLLELCSLPRACVTPVVLPPLLHILCGTVRQLATLRGVYLHHKFASGSCVTPGCEACVGVDSNRGPNVRPPSQNFGNCTACIGRDAASMALHARVSKRNVCATATRSQCFFRLSALSLSCSRATPLFAGLGAAFQ